jgi:hypothetical protein
METRPITTLQEVGATKYDKDQTKRNILLLWWHPRFPDGPDAVRLYVDHIPVCCMACAREYSDLTRMEIAFMESANGCPSDDCTARK